jgi:hypothetical protein
MIPRVSQKPNHVVQTMPVQVLGQEQAFVDVFFQAS